jgi:hypothetical protein
MLFWGIFFVGVILALLLLAFFNSFPEGPDF